MGQSALSAVNLVETYDSILGFYVGKANAVEKKKEEKL